MKKIVQLPLIKQKEPSMWKVFGVSLSDLKKQGLLKDGIPLVVRNMVEYLMENGMQQEGLFRVNGNVKAVERLRRRCESRETVDLLQEADICSVASLLKQFLRDLPGGVITSTVQTALIHLYHDYNEDQLKQDLKEILQQLPEIHYCLLKYLCHFLTQVEKQQKDNRMTVFNLATVFGPNVFHVSTGVEGMKEQDICNKIMAVLIENYSTIFETDGHQEELKEEHPKVITVRDAGVTPLKKCPGIFNDHRETGPQFYFGSNRQHLFTVCACACHYTEALRPTWTTGIPVRDTLSNTLGVEVPIPLQRKKKATYCHVPQQLDFPSESASEMSTSVTRKKKVRKSKSEVTTRPMPPPVLQPELSAGEPQVRLRSLEKAQSLEDMDLSNDEPFMAKSSESLSRNKRSFFTGTFSVKSVYLCVFVQGIEVTKIKFGPKSHIPFIRCCTCALLEESEAGWYKSALSAISPGSKEDDRPISPFYMSFLQLSHGKEQYLFYTLGQYSDAVVSIVASQRWCPGFSSRFAVCVKYVLPVFAWVCFRAPFSSNGPKTAQVPSVNSKPGSEDLLEKTIRSAVEQHLFDMHGSGGQSSEDSESGLSSTSTAVTARQRRRHQKEQDEVWKHKDTEDINKENIPSVLGSSEDGQQALQEAETKQRDSGPIEECTRPKKHKFNSKLLAHTKKQDGPINKLHDNGHSSSFLLMKVISIFVCFKNRILYFVCGFPQIFLHAKNYKCRKSMKIQEIQTGCETAKTQRHQEADACEESSVPEVPRLDLSALTEDSNWGEPIPAYSAWHTDDTDGDEARLSPQAGGRLIRQLLEEDSDPMVSPRFYAFGQSQQYLDDTEVPPSPPNAHSFMSRRRSSSLGSCEEDREELTSAQLSKKIHSLKKKIHKYEEKFEEERKYRPSHSDKAANPEVLRWMNELAKLRKELKELKLKMSEEDMPPVTRQRSNTLPKSFGSQLEKEPTVEKIPKPPVEATLESVLKKLQEKRAEVSRPEDIKDMTREQISAEKVALQKALLYYESIHGRPVTKSERQVMKPLYDRYRLVKQILCRASTIPVIGSPSSKRRGPLLQPIIEGEPALFFEDIKEHLSQPSLREEEEDGSEDESNTKANFTVTMKPEFNVRSFLDQLDEEVDGFISPVDEISPSKNNMDMRLSNLHSATMPELVEQLQEAREDKKRIRKKLREFEDKFFRQNGRNVQKEDRTPMAEEYNEYKHVKAKLRLLEVLISKRDSSKII
ncbi:FA13A protein, partial [Atractosteus spatula]|nr:FA13A protein [Atractosteus spatula]